jgi:hypothetical protein
MGIGIVVDARCRLPEGRSMGLPDSWGFDIPDCEYPRHWHLVRLVVEQKIVACL